MELYVLMLSRSGGYLSHSVHETKPEAEAWDKCKQHDGEDTSILTLDEDTIDRIVVLAENLKEKRK